MKSGIRVLCFIFIFSVFSVCFALNRCVNTDESVVNDVASDVLTIVIDAGHGGQDPGAVEGNVREADINLDIAQRLRDKLTSKGFNVVMTRETDDGLYLGGHDKWEKTEDMKARKSIVTSSGASMLLSIHQNFFSDRSACGAQVFFNGSNPENEKLAQIVQTKLAEVARKENTRAIVRKDELFILKNNEMPSILIECGFISNEEERTILCNEDYKDELAEAIYEGVCEYLGVESNESQHQETIRP